MSFDWFSENVWNDQFFREKYKFESFLSFFNIRYMLPIWSEFVHNKKEKQNQRQTVETTSFFFLSTKTKKIRTKNRKRWERKRERGIKEGRKKKREREGKKRVKIMYNLDSIVQTFSFFSPFHPRASIFNANNRRMRYTRLTRVIPRI